MPCPRTKRNPKKEKNENEIHGIWKRFSFQTNWDFHPTYPPPARHRGTNPRPWCDKLE